MHTRIIAATVLILAIGALFFFTITRKDAPATAPIKEESAKIVTNVPQYGDMDADGLPDWEERLRETDAANPDTDGDGTPDGEEVQSLRDPLKNGTDAVQQRTSVLTQSYQPARYAPARLPTRAENPEEETATPNAIGQSDARIAELRAFGNVLGAALQPLVSDAFGSELQRRLAETIRAQNAEVFRALRPLGETFERVSRSFPPAGPHGTAAITAGFKEGTGAVAKALSALSAAKPDDFGALEKHWRGYSDAMLVYATAAHDAIVLFRDGGVIFTPTEPGFIFSLAF